MHSGPTRDSRASSGSSDETLASNRACSSAPSATTTAPQSRRRSSNRKPSSSPSSSAREPSPKNQSQTVLIPASSMNQRPAYPAPRHRDAHGSRKSRGKGATHQLKAITARLEPHQRPRAHWVRRSRTRGQPDRADALHQAGLPELRKVAAGNDPQQSTVLRGNTERALRNIVVGRKNRLFAEFAKRMCHLEALLRDGGSWRPLGSRGLHADRVRQALRRKPVDMVERHRSPSRDNAPYNTAARRQAQNPVIAPPCKGRNPRT